MNLQPLKQTIVMRAQMVTPKTNMMITTNTGIPTTLKHQLPQFSNQKKQTD